jgi:hypothetical protein
VVDAMERWLKIASKLATEALEDPLEMLLFGAEL